ncbi:hypothetical protein L1049_024469 [Liquidambar formosana]|uniref:BHLH domain-containing protein n=1 Tax=Liquidambar formosana TaxID=63359 RepID=A0AAP0WYI9_LIQFO
MLHCLQSPENHAGNSTDMTVLERQGARLLWLQQQPDQQNFVTQNSTSLEFYQTALFHGLTNNDFGNLPIPRTEFVTEKMGFSESEIVANFLEMGHSFSRTSSCLPAAAATTTSSMAGAKEKSGNSILLEKMVSSSTGRDSLKKRKAEVEFGVTEDGRDKRIKADAEEGESKAAEKNSRESSADTSKENSKFSEVQKPDYIHVRARRGQATDSHSLAERARREKIGKKMKCLQDLVPGCNKITGRAGMLDEIINYVQSLQQQVEFLSMKLAALNPRLDFNIDNSFKKEFPAYVAGFPTADISSSEMPNLACLQFSPVKQGDTSCVLDVPITPPQAPQRTTGSSIPIPEIYLDSSCFPQVQPYTTLDSDLQSLYNVEFH